MRYMFAKNLVFILGLPVIDIHIDEPGVTIYTYSNNSFETKLGAAS